MPTKVKLLSNADIYDVYGCHWLLAGHDHQPLDSNEKFIIEDRVREIKEFYVNSAKARIRAEAGYLGLDLGDGSLEFMLHKVRDIIGKEVEQQLMSGGPMNLMQTILGAHQKAGTDLKGIDLNQYGLKKVEKKPAPSVDPNWFRKAQGEGYSYAPSVKTERMFDNPKWHQIAKAFVNIEQATDPVDITVKIDILNALQHNSFHVLIDLQTGRMLENKSTGDNYGKDENARKNLQEILDIAKGKKEPVDFADKMSDEIAKLIRKYARR